MYRCCGLVEIIGCNSSPLLTVAATNQSLYIGFYYFFIFLVVVNNTPITAAAVTTTKHSSHKTFNLKITVIAVGTIMTKIIVAATTKNDLRNKIFELTTTVVSLTVTKNNHYSYSNTTRLNYFIAAGFIFN
jgi:general stress protein CsbA